MSDSCCSPCSPQLPPVTVPGPQGATGTAGAAGTNGINAFALLTAGMTVPGDTVTPVTVTVDDSQWVVIGQILIIGQGTGSALVNPGPATFKVTAIPSPTSITMLWLNYGGDVAAGTAIDSGAVVSPAGVSSVDPYAVATFAAGTYSVAFTPAPTSYVAGARYKFKAANASTGATQVNFNGLGAKTLLKLGTQALIANDIVSGQIVEAVYDGTNFQMISATQPYWLTATATLDFPNTNAQLSADLTITVTGAVVGDCVVLGVDNASVNANTCYTAWVSAADTVTVRFNNYSSGAVNPASGTFRVAIPKF